MLPSFRSWLYKSFRNEFAFKRRRNWITIRLISNLYAFAWTRKSLSSFMCFKISFSFKSLETRYKLWFLIDERAIFCFFWESDFDSFFMILCESSSTSRILLFFFFLLRIVWFKEVTDLMNLMSLMSLITLMSILTLMNEKSLINFFDLVNFSAFDLILDSTDIDEKAVSKDNKLLIIFCFFVLISSASIFFISSLITSWNLMKLSFWINTSSSRISFLFVIQFFSLMIFSSDSFVSCNWYHSVAMMYHHTFFSFSILYELFLFFHVTILACVTRKMLGKEMLDHLDDVEQYYRWW